MLRRRLKPVARVRIRVDRLMKHGTSHIFTPQITCDGALVWLVFALPDDLRAFDPLPMLQTV